MSNNYSIYIWSYSIKKSRVFNKETWWQLLDTVPPSVAVLSVRKSHSMPGPPAFQTDSSVSQQPIYLKPFNTMIHRKNNKMALGPPTDFHNRILLINLVQKPTYPKNRDIIEILFFLTRSIHLGVGKNIANLISIIFL